MNGHHALIIDDEPDILELLELTLERMGLKVSKAMSVGGGLQMLATQKPDLCFTDMRLPDGSGMEVIEHINKTYPDIPVAMITAHGNTEAAVLALKAGAFDFVSKPVDLNILRNLVQAALRLRAEKTKDQSNSTQRLSGESQLMQRVRATIGKLARSQAPVYVSGESGTGKELAARLIHDLGPRFGRPFVPVNCGAIPSELMESEFFGHKKGSFTGAVGDKDGLFHAANGGTLFLDEVADLPLHMQVKLLRVIQEKTVRPIGARAETPIDVRILSASHKNLSQLVEKGQFRQDLYYRINVIELRMPPLRERTEDIPALAQRILDRMAPEWGVERPTLSRDALASLVAYEFPGNVRELENTLERAIALCEDNQIHAADLMLGGPQARRLADVGTGPSAPRRTGEQPSIREPGGQVNLAEMIDTIERDTIMKALEECRFNKTAAAKKLGLTFRALRYRLKKLGLE
jgi:two-component system, NtrC family, response regulator PilR